MDKHKILDTNQADFVVSYLTLRKMIGLVTLLIPIVIRLGARYFEGISADSISAYYYTGMRDVFVSTLVMGGALLACYRTPKWYDNAMATIAGLAGIGVGLFPMEPTYAPEILQKFPAMLEKECYVVRGILGYHFVFVAIFFGLAFVLVFFRFGAFTPQRPTLEKQRRNIIYRILGAAMFLAFISIGILRNADRGASIFWPETIALGSFAIAWLVKGQTFPYLRDTEPQSWRE